jgi:hypothetical protein
LGRTAEGESDEVAGPTGCVEDRCCVEWSKYRKDLIEQSTIRSEFVESIVAHCIVFPVLLGKRSSFHG